MHDPIWKCRRRRKRNDGGEKQHTALLSFLSDLEVRSCRRRLQAIVSEAGLVRDRYSDNCLYRMQTFRASLAWHLIIFLALFIGAQPSVPLLHVELSSRNEDQLLAPTQARETLALSALAGKKDLSKLIPLGLMLDCLVAVRLTGTILTVSFAGSGPQPSVLSFSHNRSPPSVRR